MKIIYNNTVLSEADNLQDLSLNLIYKKIGLFLNKPNYKSNILIPDTLRSYNELVSCFKDEKCIEKFNNYLDYRIISEFDNEKVKFYRTLTNSSDELLMILILNYFSNYGYSFESSEIESELFNAKNPDNISISDIVLCFSYIDDNYNNNIDKKFIEFLKIYVSFRILKSNNIQFKTNLLFGGLVNHHYEIFPRQLKDNVRRDQIIFNYKTVIEQHGEFEIWLNYFIPSIGLLKSDYRLDDENVFERKRLTKRYETAYFSPIFPILSLFCLNNKLDNESELVQKCIVWAENNEPLKDLFSNPVFVYEFNKRLDNYSKHNLKETLGNYSSIIYEYIFKGIPHVISELKDKYPTLSFLSPTSVIDNPIYEMWNSDIENYSNVIDSVYTHNHLNSYSSDIIALAQTALNKYGKYFDKNEKNSSQGTKQAMNYLVKLFEKDKDIHNEFKKFRLQMDRQYNNGLNNIQNLLNKMANG